MIIRLRLLVAVLISLQTLKLRLKVSFCLEFCHLQLSLQALVSPGTFLPRCMPSCHRARIFLISKGADCYQLWGFFCFLFKERLTIIKPLEQKVFPNPPRAKALIHVCQLKAVFPWNSMLITQHCPTDFTY